MSTSKASAQQLCMKILNECLSARKKKNPAYSRRAFARDIKVSPGFASLLLAGKRTLSLDRAQDICEILQIPSKQKKVLLRAVASATTRSRLPREKIDEILFGESSDQDRLQFEVDKFRYFRNWYHVAILDLVSTRGFNADSAWIAKRLGIKKHEAHDAIERLFRLRLLKKSGQKIFKSQSHIDILPTKPELAIREYHQQMLERAALALKCPETLAVRDISSMTMAIDPEKIPEARELIRDFKSRLCDLLTDGDSTEVYQLNVQLFPLTKTEVKP